MSLPVTEQTAELHDVRLRYLECGQGPVVILAHGFPETSYSWRHQLPALAGAGFRAVAPDQRGYGGSSSPAAVADYDIVHLTGDLVQLLDHLGHDKAVFVGHDWGALVVWSLAQLHPERVAGVCGLSVPFSPRPPIPPTQAWARAFAGLFFYMSYFQAPGAADAELATDPHRTFRRLLTAMRIDDKSTGSMKDDGRGWIERLPEPAALPGWLTEQDIDHFAATFAATGFTGGLNWYRNFDRNWELTEALDGAGVAAPSLFIGGTQDPVRMMAPPAAQAQFLSDLRGITEIEGGGHWIQQERPEEVNAALLSFLAALDLR